ncbi:MAG: OsmC family peroxiredoxin [Pedobacter sp.]|nr:MAG: OsmC family peroxiredoxin [Pedobacter sp.]
MEINLTRKNNLFHFEAKNASGELLQMDANPVIGGEGKGFRPMETLLAGLGGCSGIDVVNILTKQKAALKDLQIQIKASRKETEIPAIFEEINVHYILIGDLEKSKVEKALQLTFDKYCSVAHILGATARLSYTFEIKA